MRLIKIFIIVFQSVFCLGAAIAQNVISIEERLRSCTSFREILAWPGSYLLDNVIQGPPSREAPNIVHALVLAPLAGNERSIVILEFDGQLSSLAFEIFDDSGNSRLLKKYETVATCRDGVIFVAAQIEVGDGESGKDHIRQSSELTRYATGVRIGLERTFTPLRNPSKAVVRKATY